MNDEQLAGRISRVLDERALPAGMADKLASARRRALAGEAPHASTPRHHYGRGLALAASVMLVIVGWRQFGVGPQPLQMPGVASVQVALMTPEQQSRAATDRLVNEVLMVSLDDGSSADAGSDF